VPAGSEELARILSQSEATKYLNAQYYHLLSLFHSDPYCKIKLFRGDRDYGEIDSVVTETIKKVNKLLVLFKQ